jgi:cobalt-zinc-cadmium efflux system outer membrane protein
MPTERETMTTAMIPLEPFYQRGPRIRQAGELKRAADADAAGQRQQLAVDAAGAFYRVALAQVNVDATRSLAQWFDTVVTYNSIRVREGVTAEADLIRSQLERDHVLNELAIEESDLARARADLQIFLGPAPESAPIQVDVDSLPLALPADAGATIRPEVRAAEARLLASESATASERRMLLREVGAMVGTKTMAGSSSLVAGFTLPFPLLDQNRGMIASARAESDIARSELEVTRRSADADLQAARDAARILTQRVAVVGNGDLSYLNRAAEGRRIALGAYREGGTSLLQVIDAARAWREARASYFETLFAQHLSVIRLLVSQGIDVFRAWPSLRAGAPQ